MDHCSIFLSSLCKLGPNIGSVVTEDGYLENKDLWREGNGPFALIKEPGAPCVVLIHGLSDSPYSVRDLSIALNLVGYNVVSPLLPGHGLLDPDKEFEDGAHTQWRLWPLFAHNCSHQNSSLAVIPPEVRWLSTLSLAWGRIHLTVS
jgi:pimeloyl-ACP methyl ester carboxylesterase